MMFLFVSQNQNSGMPLELDRQLLATWFNLQAT